MACCPLRREASCVHRRERVSHFHDALEGQSSERRERAYGKVPRNLKARTHYALIASITLQGGMGASI
jgi:hypothetical protein